MIRLMTFALCLCATTLFAETRAAFVLGNASYDNATPLRNPARDSALIADTLRGLDFTVTEHSNLGRDGFSRALSDFLKTHDGADVMLFYFAGHGMQFEGRNYLVPVDAVLASELDIAGETLALDRVVDLLQRRAKSTLVFVDACRNNPLAEQFYRENFSETRATMTRGLAPMNTKSDGAMVVFSASPGQVAFDGDGANSAFAAALAQHLPTENAEVLSLMKRVIRDVKGATGDKQVPMVRNDLINEIYLRKASLRPKISEDNGPGNKAVSEASPAESRVFMAARRMDSARGWYLFLSRFPEGFHFQDAEKALEVSLAKEMALASGITGDVRTSFRPDGQIVNDVEEILGLTRADRAAVQALLTRLGYDTGGLDGALGQRSREAIQRFQNDREIPVTGAVTPATAKALGLRLKLNPSARLLNISSVQGKVLSKTMLKQIEPDPRLKKAMEIADWHLVIYGYWQDRLYFALKAATPTLDKVSPESAIYLAEVAGGYLARLESAEERGFVEHLTRYDSRFTRMRRSHNMSELVPRAPMTSGTVNGGDAPSLIVEIDD